MDLGLLRHDFVCVANMAVRAIGHGLDHADMHVMNDTHGYLRFSHEIEEIARRHSIPYRFLNIRARSIWQKLPERGAEPIFIVPHTEKLLSVGAVPPIVEGIASGGSVLISAAIVLRHLGFDPIYVIGCDLDYETRGKYFYRAGANDISHENDPVVQRRRAGMSEVNGQFEVLRRDFLRRGNEILNAGVGGNLNALPRVCFASLFPGETRDGG